jgi:hypothetical protein
MPLELLKQLAEEFAALDLDGLPVSELGECLVALNELSSQAVHVYDTFEGAIMADMQFATVEGAIWRDELDRLTDEIWRSSTDVERADVTIGQRQALAQVEMARRSAEWTATMSGQVVPLFVGVVDLDVLEGRTGRLCQTGRGGRITPENVHEPMEGANFAPLITGPGGAVLHFGRTRRVASSKQRQAAAIRDAHCSFAGCDRPAGQSDVHHLVPWDAGGVTDIENLVLLCHRHRHEVVHQRGFTVDLEPDRNGQRQWRRPDGTPIPNRYRDWLPATDPPLGFQVGKGRSPTESQSPDRRPPASPHGRDEDAAP